MEYIKENWGTILIFGLILFGVTRCVQNSNDDRERRSLKQEERQIQEKINLKKRMLEAEPFIEIMKKYNPKNFDRFKIPKERSEFYTIDIEKFFSDPDQQYFFGTFRLQDIYSESGQQIMLLRSYANWINTSIRGDRQLYFKISCDMDIIEKIYDVDWYEQILVIFTVGRVLSSDPKERTTQKFGEYQDEESIQGSELFTSVNGNCLALTKSFTGLVEKLKQEDLYFLKNEPL